MSRLRTLLVDDEPPARERLRRLLAADDRIEIVGEAGDGLEAVRLTESMRPDLLLLDVQMPGLGGFEVLGALETEAVPHVIFVTAYDEFALRAFEVRALDYLMKPVAPERLEAAIDRVAGADGRRELSSVAREISGESGPLERFLVRGPGRLSLIRAADVDWFEASGNYVKLHAAGRSHLVRSTLTELEARLDPGTFVRIHRSTLVNLDAVVELHPVGHADLLVTMRDGAELRMSRRYRDRLPATLEG